MKDVFVDLSFKESIIDQINTQLKGKIENSYNEQKLIFDTKTGKGKIRSIDFEWGISLLDYNVTFNEDIKITYKLSKANPIEFLFISEGHLSYASEDTEQNDDFINLECYQNIILSNLPKSNNIFIFPKGESIRLNVIKVYGNKYHQKYNHHINSLQKPLRSILEGKKTLLPFKHLGSFNLELVDIIESLNNNNDEGIVRFLNIEGQLNLILALQILEHKSFESNIKSPNSLQKLDLIKTKTISKYISEHIEKKFTISELASMHNFSSKKMQTGFKELYSKTVNEYIRDKKLELARSLIEKTDLSISEITYKIGYKSRSYFSSTFYETYKILPTKYRELLNEKKPT